MIPTLRFAKAELTCGRVLKPELLDSAAGELRDRNLQDIARINRWCGGHRILLRVLRDIVSPRDGFSVLDVGAASGDMGQCIREVFPRARLLLTDYRLAHLRNPALPRVAADAFRLPFLPGTFDFVVCSSVLHHFPDEEVVELIRQTRCLARRALIILDLERHPIPYHFLPMTRQLFGWSTLTVHDGPISVAAGFRADELESLARAAGASVVTVRKHRPWFRLSAVVPAITVDSLPHSSLRYAIS